MEPFIADDGQEYYVSYVHPVQAAVLRAIEAFEGRNWRRVKREMNKAWRRARAEHRKRKVN